ncbi:MAG: alpha/beta fold hydrolase [Candidatus Sericytochromatia bacterium]|nr:alpha/beta fold hydrolase [Candidatus Sericytochromatia bacterium]
MPVLYPLDMVVAFPGDEDLLLQPACRGRILKPDAGTARGTLVAFHGYSAGPWQFDELADAMCARGWNVVLPRLAGHGFATVTGEEDPGDLPKAHEAHRYREEGDKALALARTLDAPLVLCGLSAGGALALDLAIRHRDIARACVMAPLLLPAPWRARVAMGMLQAVDGPAGGSLGRWLDRQPFAWGKTPPRHEDGWVRPGHWRFRAGNLAGILGFVAGILPEAGRLTLPLQVLSTSLDDLADPKGCRILWERQRGTSGGWLHFPASAAVPHGMVSPRQHPDAQSRRLVTDATLKFLDTGTATHVPPEGGRVRG